MSNEQKMPSELMPCPFCGQQDAFVEQLDSDASVVICQGRIDEYSACLARGPVGVQQDESEDQPGHNAAINEWNRRAAQQPQGEPDGTTSDKYRAELYDEVFELVRGLGYMNVTTAVSTLRSERDQLQADLTQRDERVDTLEAMLLKIATNLGGTLEQYGLLKEVAALVRIKDAAAQESAEPDHTPTITIPPGAERYDGSDNGVD